MDLFGHDNPLTALRPNLNNVDPDDAFSSVPYEKGFSILYYLEQLLGGPNVFEPYMQAYVTNFAGKTVTTKEWLAFLLSYVEKNLDQSKLELLKSVDWDKWLFTPGPV